MPLTDLFTNKVGGYVLPVAAGVLAAMTPGAARGVWALGSMLDRQAELLEKKRQKTAFEQLLSKASGGFGQQIPSDLLTTVAAMSPEKGTSALTDLLSEYDKRAFQARTKQEERTYQEQQAEKEREYKAYLARQQVHQQDASELRKRSQENRELAQAIQQGMEVTGQRIGGTTLAYPEPIKERTISNIVNDINKFETLIANAKVLGEDTSNLETVLQYFYNELAGKQSQVAGTPQIQTPMAGSIIGTPKSQNFDTNDYLRRKGFQP